MAVMSIVTNIRYWIFAAILIGMIVGDIGGTNDASYLMLSLILMMCFSLSGLHFTKKDFSRYRKQIVIATFLSSIVSTIVTLCVGLMYNPDLWGGWVILACVPSGISTISATLIMKGDVKLVTLATTVIYIVAIGITPLFSYLLIGNTIDPFNFIKYVFLFILIPLIASYPIGKMKIPKNINSVIINICFFFMVLISFGRSRDIIISEPYLVILIILGCLIRITVLHLIAEHVMKALNIPRRERVPYCLLLVWRNSGLAMTLAMLLMPETPAATLPPAISMIFEVFYFIFMIWYYEYKVPAEEENITPQAT